MLSASRGLLVRALRPAGPPGRWMTTAPEKLGAGPGDLLSWGDNSKLQLGHREGPSGLLWKSLDRPAVVDVLKGSFVQRLACGPEHSAVVTAAGELYAWGNGEDYRLGHGDADPVPLPFKVASLQDVRIVDVACGTKHTACVDADGGVWTWGFGGSFFSGAGGLGHGDTATQMLPKLVQDLKDEERRIVQVACGSQHTVALDDEGAVWTWGKGEYGRLGLGHSSDAAAPELVELMTELEPVVQIAAGSGFTLALTVSGDVYGWGKNDHNQLGTGGDLVDMFSAELLPCRIERLSAAALGERVAHIAAGENCAACCTESGRVFYWGARMWNEPHEAVALKDHKITRVAAGKTLTLAISDKGRVFSWGKGMSGQLGRPTSGKMQPGLIESLADVPIAAIACGSHHVLAVAGDPPAPLTLE